MESLVSRFGRRILTIPLVTLAGILFLLLLPLWLPVALVADFLRPGPPVVARFGLCLVVYFIMEFFGVIGCFLLFLLRILHIIPNRTSYLRAHYILQHMWGTGLLRGSFFLLKLKLKVSGAEHFREGPALVFMRHVTLLDTLLPAASFGQPRTVQLRYLLKKELLYVPSLDICGNRIPNVFVDRSGKNREEMLNDVETLASGLGEEDALILYPEGTRFTLGKQKRLRAKLAASGNTQHLRQAERLQNLHPVRIGGPNACFKAAHNADVLIVGHVGFEGAASLRHFLSGRVYNRTIHVRIWRTPNAELPEGLEARGEWLNARWEELDAWIQGFSSNDTNSRESDTSGTSQSA